MGISLTQLLVILLIVLILFGAGKLPKVMSDLGKGVKNFRDELNKKQDDSTKEKNDEKNKE